MRSVDPTVLLLQLGVLLSVALLLGRLAERAGLPATTGELAAGLVLGPSLLGNLAGASWLFASTDGRLEPLRGLALFCGVLLIGVAGSSLDLGFVRTRWRSVSVISLGALGAPLLATAALAHIADARLHGPHAQAWSFAVFAGLALSVSAVPVIVKIFADLGVLHRNLSQLSLSVAVIDDAVVWIGLSVITAALHSGQPVSGAWLFADPLVAMTAVLALGAVALMARRTIATTDHDPGVGTSALVAVAFITLGAVFTSAVGLDSTLGAFVCGALVASGRLVPVVRLRPLRTVVLGVLAPLFLATSALSADLTALRDPALLSLAVAAVLLAVVTKSLGAYAGARLARLGSPAALVLASALNARGTVQLIVAAAGLRLGLISHDGFTILVLVALVTSAMAGPMIRRFIGRIPPTTAEDDRAQRV